MQGKNEAKFEQYQLAEIKHSRLAMLAFSGLVATLSFLSAFATLSFLSAFFLACNSEVPPLQQVSMYLSIGIHSARYPQTEAAESLFC